MPDTNPRIACQAGSCVDSELPRRFITPSSLTAQPIPAAAYTRPISAQRVLQTTQQHTKSLTLHGVVDSHQLSLLFVSVSPANLVSRQPCGVSSLSCLCLRTPPQARYPSRRSPGTEAPDELQGNPSARGARCGSGCSAVGQRRGGGGSLGPWRVRCSRLRRVCLLPWGRRREGSGLKRLCSAQKRQLSAFRQPSCASTCLPRLIKAVHTTR